MRNTQAGCVRVIAAWGHGHDEQGKGGLMHTRPATRYLRLLRSIQGWVDHLIDRHLAKGWSPKHEGCDDTCAYCGYLCERCGRP